MFAVFARKNLIRNYSLALLNSRTKPNVWGTQWDYNSLVVIYEAFCLDVTQGCVNGEPNEIQTHTCRFAHLACNTYTDRRNLPLKGSNFSLTGYQTILSYNVKSSDSSVHVLLIKFGSIFLSKKWEGKEIWKGQNLAQVERQENNQILNFHDLSKVLLFYISFYKFISMITP